MSEYAWFKLLIRAVGVLMLGLGGPMIVWYAARLIVAGVPGSPGATSRSLVSEATMAVPGLLAYGSQAALGWYLIFRGEWFIKKVLGEIQGRCAMCGYDLHGLKADACPECNAPIRTAAAKPNIPISSIPNAGESRDDPVH